MFDDLLEKLKCETCSKCLVMSIHTSNRNESLISELEQENIHNVCLAFADECIAEIGNFSYGCEEWEQETPEQKKQKEKAKTSVYNRIFAP